MRESLNKTMSDGVRATVDARTIEEQNILGVPCEHETISLRFDDLGSNGKPARLGLMGGTFDPIHIAHLVIAERARVQFGLDAVLFIPTGNPVFKKDVQVTSAEIRQEMVRRAIASNPAFDVCPLEVDRGGDTYTIDTLRTLRAHYPSNVSFYFIIGADAAAYLWKWRAREEIAQMTRIVVARRAGVGLTDEQVDRIREAAPFQLDYVDVPALDISSTNVRMRSQNGETVRYLVPEEVYAAIGEFGLYQPTVASSESCTSAYIEDGELGMVARFDDAFSDTFFEARQRQLERRVKPKRFKHVMGVVAMADKLARAYDVDVQKARLGGLLHDWDKGYDDSGIRARARFLNVAFDARVFDGMPQLLHGPTAAAALGRAYPQIPADVLLAIARHTAGACGMNDLEMVVYIADALEENRDFPGVESLRKLVGDVSLEDLFVKTFSHTLEYVMGRGQTMHPATVDIWNYYARRTIARRRS